MALTYVTSDGTLVIPSAPASWQTAPANSGVSTTGVVILVGEADTGPDFSSEADITENFFGPRSFAAVQAKYGSGRLVDAYRELTAPSLDAQVRGAPSAVYLLKTNKGTKASLALATGYGILRAKQEGSLGNLLSAQVISEAAEVTASLGVGFLHFTAAETVYISANGGTRVLLDVTGATPAAFVATNTAACAAQNVTLGGGVVYQPANGLVAVTAAVTVSGNVITVTLTGGTWATTPTVGQVLVIGNGSSITGAANANSGQYVVEAATANTVVARKYIDTAGAVLTPPVAVVGPATANAAMLDAYTSVTFTSAVANAVGGDSVTLFTSAGPGAHFVNGITQLAPGVSGANIFASSSVESVRSIKVSRSTDNVAETLKAGGNVALTVGHVGTASAPVVIDATNVTLGGSVVIPKANFKTIGDLATFVSAQTNWTAAVAGFSRSLPPSALDLGTFEANQNGAVGTMPARIKRDAYDMSAAVAASRVVEFQVAPTAGLPTVASVAFLTGGTKGGTTNAAVQAALQAAALVQGNFVVPLFSCDAATDIALGDTDAGSTYDIASINAALSAHVSAASQFKVRKPRQGFPSFRGSYAASKSAAQSLSNFRCAGINFLDVSALGSNGLQWFQPWMAAVNEAGMQAAGFYRPLFNKSINVSGVRHAAGEFKPTSDDQVEDALLNGLTVIAPRLGGGFKFVSDNTTYGVDANFVLNSVQAVYVADVVAQTTSMRMEAAFVGQSFADVSPTVALAFFKNIMASLKVLKLITASSDAPAGFKNVLIDIEAPAMLVSAEVKLATGIYFAPIKFLVTQVQGTATA